MSRSTAIAQNRRLRDTRGVKEKPIRRYMCVLKINNDVLAKFNRH